MFWQRSRDAIPKLKSSSQGRRARIGAFMAAHDWNLMHADVDDTLMQNERQMQVVRRDEPVKCRSTFSVFRAKHEHRYLLTMSEWTMSSQDLDWEGATRKRSSETQVDERNHADPDIEVHLEQPESGTTPSPIAASTRPIPLTQLSLARMRSSTTFGGSSSP